VNLLKQWIRVRPLLGAACLLAHAGSVSAADFYVPSSGAGPAVVLISGASGKLPYRWYAMDVAKLGYTVVVVPGRDICPSSSNSCPRNDEESAENMRKTIVESQDDKRVVRGKVAVVGFSLGGGGALVHATPLADSVAGVVAYYPSISKISDLREVAARVATPTLLLAGERDKYFNCCLVESMREFASGTRAGSVSAELVIYPDADHGFNLDGMRYRPVDTVDAWERTKAFLSRVHPLR
jgi:dienelactone hydrolase